MLGRTGLMKNTKAGDHMHDCSACLYYDNEVTEEPCFKCLSGYFDKKYFTKTRDKHAKAFRIKEELHSSTRVYKKIDKIDYKSEETPLPWSS